MTEPAPVSPPLPTEAPAWVPPPPLRPIPFEDPAAHPAFWGRVSATFDLAFSDPMGFCERIPAGSGLGGPFSFLMLLSAPALLLVAVILIVMTVVLLLPALQHGVKPEHQVLVVLGPVLLGVILLLVPLFSYLGMVVGGALTHASLWAWGGLRPGAPMTHTLRANGYAMGFMQLAGMVPFLGVLLQIACLAVLGMGLARMHRTATWRGVCAALTPLALLLGLVVLVMVLVVGRAGLSG